MSSFDRFLNKAFPQQSRRRLWASFAYTAVTRPHRLHRRFNRENFFLRRHFARMTFLCNVCGNAGTPIYDMTDKQSAADYDYVLQRETLRCLRCDSTMRHRTIASALLEEIATRTGRSTATIEDLASVEDGELKILDTDTFSPISSRLSQVRGYVRSKFLPNRPFGVELEPEVFNIDLQRIDFPSERFDIILTSDVMEHVRDDSRAHQEIWRCLRGSGIYIFTVPFRRNMLYTKRLVDVSTNRDIFLCPPHLHGDPLTSGVLAYRIYGQQLIAELQALGFVVEYRPTTSVKHAIFDGDIFLARKPVGKVPPETSEKEAKLRPAGFTE